MMGLDAWRRVVRFIDHGRDIRLETLRNEVRTIRSRYLIKSLEEVVVGIAKFENEIQEFVDAGGKRPEYQEMKSDLNAILPSRLSENLLFKQTDVSMTYDAFKAFVESQTAMTLMNAGRLPVNNLEDRNECQVVPENNGDEEEEEVDIDAAVADLSRTDLIAFVKRAATRQQRAPR